MVITFSIFAPSFYTKFLQGFTSRLSAKPDLPREQQDAIVNILFSSPAYLPPIWSPSITVAYFDEYQQFLNSSSRDTVDEAGAPIGPYQSAFSVVFDSIYEFRDVNNNGRYDPSDIIVGPIYDLTRAFKSLEVNYSYPLTVLDMSSVDDVVTMRVRWIRNA